MKNQYEQYQNDVSNTANNIITQMVCAEKGVDYNHVLQLAQQTHINGILQQEQWRQFNQVLNRHYGGSTFVGKLKEVFSGGTSSMLPSMGMVGMPQLPMAPSPAVYPGVVNAQLNPAQVAGMLGQQLAPSSPSVPSASPDHEQLKKDVEELKQLLAGFQQMMTGTQSPPI